MAFEREVQDFKAEGTDLPESKLETGFLPGEKPPANWFNSLIYRLTQSVKEIQTKAIEQEYVDTKVSEESQNTKKYTDNQISSTNESLKKYVDDQMSSAGGSITEITKELETKAETVVYEATIPSSGWTTSAPFYVDLSVTGILATDNPLITPKYSGTLSNDQLIQEAWNKIDRVIANKNTLRVYAFEEVPTTNIPVQIQVVR